jgi:hypothetical protein
MGIKRRELPLLPQASLMQITINLPKFFCLDQYGAHHSSRHDRISTIYLRDPDTSTDLVRIARVSSTAGGCSIRQRSVDIGSLRSVGECCVEYCACVDRLICPIVDDLTNECRIVCWVAAAHLIALAQTRHVGGNSSAVGIRVVVAESIGIRVNTVEPESREYEETGTDRIWCYASGGRAAASCIGNRCA